MMGLRVQETAQWKVELSCERTQTTGIDAHQQMFPQMSSINEVVHRYAHVHGSSIRSSVICEEAALESCSSCKFLHIW